MHKATLFALVVLLISPALLAQVQKTREQAVLADRKQFENDDSWIYNDLDQGIRIAKGDNKPLLVIFRCLPCEACALFDEQVGRRDPVVKALMDQFICVRIPMANTIDLSQFQFDYDLSFTAFMMNADKTIYGRFGTRSSRPEAEKDISLEGFAAALQGALMLHKKYPANKKFLAGKQARPVKYESPTQFPSLRGKYQDRLDYGGKVVQSCLHCHQIRDAHREVYRNQGRPLPEKLLYPYPMPAIAGFSLDPRTRAAVESVAEGSPADEAGLKVGDELLTLDGQAILSIADVQWVLHNAESQHALEALVRRGNSKVTLSIALEEGWRKATDISWRVTTWPLRRMATGGLLLEDLDDQQRARNRLGDDDLALFVKHVGQYGPHAAAKRAGFKKGDVIIELAGQSSRMGETGLLIRLMQTTKPGQKVPVTVLRNGRRMSLALPMQK